MLAKLEEDQSKVNRRNKSLDMNECMSLENVNMSISMNNDSNEQITKNTQCMPNVNMRDVGKENFFQM